MVARRTRTVGELAFGRATCRGWWARGIVVSTASPHVGGLVEQGGERSLSGAVSWPLAQPVVNALLDPNVLGRWVHGVPGAVLGRDRVDTFR